GRRLEPDYLVDLLSSRGQHDDRQIVARTPKLFANIKTAQSRKHHVEHHQIEMLLARQRDRARAVASHGDLMSLVLKTISQGHRHGLIVFYYEQLSHHLF